MLAGFTGDGPAVFVAGMPVFIGTFMPPALCAGGNATEQ
jgi:hypothetical protein